MLKSIHSKATSTEAVCQVQDNQKKGEKGKIPDCMDNHAKIDLFKSQADCGLEYTQTSNLSRHAKVKQKPTCPTGKDNIPIPNESWWNRFIQKPHLLRQCAKFKPTHPPGGCRATVHVCLYEVDNTPRQTGRCVFGENTTGLLGDGLQPTDWRQRCQNTVNVI